MDDNKVIVTRILGIVHASEEAIAASTTQVEKINAVITAYEHIVRILKEYRL